LTVIVPVYNSGRELDRCLAGLRSSELSDFDVWVVDDGSTHPVAPIVERYGFNYLRIEGPGGPARARNRGALKAGGDFLAFIDADVVVHHDTLARMVAVFGTNPGVDGVFGCYDDSPEDSGFISQYKNLAHRYVHRDSRGEVPTFWSGCGAIRRSVFIEFGGFDEERYPRPAIEDIELGTWLNAAGHRILLDPDIQCRHLKRWTLAGMLKSDLFERGVPWTNLILRAGEAGNMLNVKTSQKACVVLVGLALAAIPVAVWFPLAWLAVAGLLLAVTTINAGFHRYFVRNRGWWFALRVVPLQYLYFVICGISVPMGWLSHYLRNEKNGPPPRRALTDIHHA